MPVKWGIYMLLIKHNNEGRAAMASILKQCADNDYIIEISGEKFIKADENEKQFVCRKMKIIDGVGYVREIFLITEKIYNFMVERQYILKVEE